ncbi:hypothetical protein [Halovenus marina]|uniref:hypothetical protein n=1 Tax=Halovenus marina TaxID=3396621 RepID=UPI003F5464CF
MPQDSIDITLYGNDLTIEHKGPDGAGARLDVSHEDGRRWLLTVTGTGSLKEIETTWRDGQLADLDEPDWLDDALHRVARVA